MARFGSFFLHLRHHPNDESEQSNVHSETSSSRQGVTDTSSISASTQKTNATTPTKDLIPKATMMSASSTRAHTGVDSSSNSQSHGSTSSLAASSGALKSSLSRANTARKSILGLTVGRTQTGESLFSHHHAAVPQVNMTSVHAERPHEHYSSSMVQLRKFFRPMRKRSHGSGSSTPRTVSHVSTGPTFTHDAHNNMIVKTDRKFWDNLEGSLTKKYGKMGKMLGSGAGGSVRLITRESDHVTFAVKEFVPRRAHESVKEYAKKCTAEFCIGSTLHHPNVIKTLDIISENNHYYEVMEYAPVDFFSVVMSGKMARSEINCCLKQITLGVNYLHSMGLAHRDLKLDNCVLTKSGILKLIDFGSAVVFKYPFEEKVVMAHGIVGSDPYMAPEILTSTSRYDPQYVDIWSIAIIYCCMTLRRFPWKAPKQTDPSFSMYCMKDDVPHDYVASAQRHKKLLLERRRKFAEKKKKEQEKKEKRVEAEKARMAAADDEEPLEAWNGNDNKKGNGVESARKDIEKLQIDEEKKEEGKGDDKKPNEKREKAKMEKKDKEKQEKKIEEHMKVETSATPATAAVALVKEEEGKVNGNQADKSKEEGKSKNDDKKSKHVDRAPERRQKGSGHTHRQIHGPYRLMRLLPHAARPLISKMLTVDISSRATMEDILADEWFSSIKYCTVDDEGHTINDPGHRHTIV